MVKLFPKEIQQKLQEVKKMDQKLHQIQLVIYKYFYSLPDQKANSAFNNLQGQWSTRLSERELDQSLKKIHQEWIKEIKEFDLD